LPKRPQGYVLQEVIAVPIKFMSKRLARRVGGRKVKSTYSKAERDAEKAAKRFKQKQKNKKDKGKKK
jgi:hypothetical protein